MNRYICIHYHNDNEYEKSNIDYIDLYYIRNGVDSSNYQG